MMLVRRMEDVPASEVNMDEVTGTRIQWLLSKKEGTPNFAMRRFTIAPGGRIPVHEHPWEHEIFVLKGKGTAHYGDARLKIRAGDSIFIPGGEPHGYDNSGRGDFVFLCMIPNSGDTR